MPRRTQISAGILVFRRKPELEVLLAHPGGPFWAKKDAGAWTIPKGLVEPGDEPIATARREFTEETNLVAEGDMIALVPVAQKSGKLVHAFVLEADFDLSQFASNMFTAEWPPKSGRRESFPESIGSLISRCRSRSSRSLPISGRCWPNLKPVSA